MVANICTILTDASFDHATKCGGWAAWIVCNGERIKKYDAIKNPVFSSDEAETIAIINGLYLAVKNFPAANRYIIQTDSLMAIRILIGTKFKSQYCESLKRKYHKYFLELKPMGAMHEFRHVKAHSGTETKRQYVNDWCDRHAKKSMRAARLKTA